MGEFQWFYSAFWSRQGPGVVFLYFSVVISSRFDSIRFEVLAKPMGVSELSALIPKELQVRETQLSEALDQVATPGNPDELVPSGSHLL